MVEHNTLEDWYQKRIFSHTKGLSGAWYKFFCFFFDIHLTMDSPNGMAGWLTCTQTGGATYINA